MKSITTLLFLASFRPSAAALPAAHLEAAPSELQQQMWMDAGSKEALDAVMNRTTLASAVAILGRINSTSSHKLGLVTRSRFLGLKGESAEAEVARWAQPQGSDKAKEILTKMIEETDKKLDAEQQRCNDFDIKQRAMIRVTKDEISTFNAASALARAGILEAQGGINEAETQLPILNGQLKKHEDECSEDLGIIKSQLALAEADVSVMDGILKQTTCTSDKIKYPTAFLQCIDLATGEAFATFRDSAVRKQIALLRQKSVRQEVLESLLQAPHFVNRSQALAVLETDMRSVDFKQDPATTTTLPTTPTTTTTANKEKTQSKCSLSNNENCFILRDRFLQIQGNLVEKVDALKIVLNHKQTKCDDTSTAFETEISTFKTQLSNSQTKLAAETTKQNNADAGSRLKNKQLDDQTKVHNRETRTCNANIGAFLGDICAITKIRTQVEMLKSGAIDPKFQVVDCAVSKWKVEACSVSCGGGGSQLSFREVLTPAKNGGAMCPLVERMQACGDIPCPVHCVMSEWTEWSACSAECGGGVRTRGRSIQVDAQHGGEPCGEKELTETCGTGGCDSDCELSGWTDWSACSKACNSGTSERTRSVEVLARGEGKCAKKDSDERFLVRPCNEQVCVPANETLQCNATKIDVIIALDSSGSLREKGWASTKVWAKKLVKAFETADAQVALVTFSGARQYSQSKACAANPAEFDIEKDCGITWLEHFTSDQAKLQSAIDGAVWTRSFTLMSLALGSAETLLATGRKDATSVVIVVTDGRPMNKDKTSAAAHKLRKKARLVFVPVTTYAPIADLKKWCSKPVRENIVQITNWETLESPAAVTAVVANVCPNVI